MSVWRGNVVLVVAVVAALLATLWFGTLSAGAATPQGTAELTAPAANAQVNGMVEVTGTAVATNFQFYKLEFGTGENPTQWSVIGELHRAQVTNGTLGTWDTSSLPDGQYVLKLTVVDNTGNWLEASRPVMIGQGAAEQPPQAEAPRRGCLACHVLVPPQVAEAEGLPPGAFTLAFEAIVNEPDHPRASPSGVSLEPTNQTGPQPCLECHRPGSGARADVGVVAPISLRDIVHPAHLFSEIFVGEFRGNCFNCHNISGTGEFMVLTEAVEVNEKGIPQVLPIPGAISVSVSQ